MVWLSGRELDDVEMHVTRIKPEGLDVLCRDTKFTRKELQIMYRGFKQVRDDSSQLKLTAEQRNEMEWNYADGHTCIHIYIILFKNNRAMQFI